MAFTYKDIDPTFEKNPVSGDLLTRTDSQAIGFSIKNLILTINGERPFNEKIGSPINKLLFELHGDQSNIVLKEIINQTIENFEPRAEVLDIIVNESPDNHSLFVVIQYRIKGTIQPLEISLMLKRTR